MLSSAETEIVKFENELNEQGYVKGWNLERAKERIAQLSKRLPNDVVLTEFFDTTVFIIQSIKNLSETVVLGGMIVIFVIFIFLRRFRSSLIVALTIPFSLIITFFMFLLFDFTINMVSMMSLAIAVGLVVDDAIVVLENITRHVESGSRPAEAAVYGSSEVGLAVMASTLAIVVVFAPMLFAGGLTGIMFTQLAAAVIVAILGSLFASLTLTPALASRLMRKASDRQIKNPALKKLFDTSERWFEIVETKYSKLLSWVLRNKKKTIGIVAAIFFGSLGLIPFLSTEFIPEGDTGDLQINFEMAPGTRMETTAAVTHELERVIRDSVPEAQDIFTYAGESGEAGEVATGHAGGPHIGSAGAKLTEQKLRDRSTKDVAEGREKIRKA